MGSSNPLCANIPGAKEPTSLTFRVAAAGIILIVSLVASSFPSLAKRAPRIEPHRLVFFVGKHFGTGVILSTAFVHLLQDGFDSLTDPCLSGGWKEWTGMIVLSSFMAIFLVEYISTVYVERISAQSSFNPTKVISDNAHHHHSPIVPYRDDPDAQPPLDFESQSNGHVSLSETIHIEREIHDGDDPQHASRPGRIDSRPSYLGHHRHESPSAHHHKAGPRLASRQLVPVVLPGQAEDPSRLLHSHSHSHAHSHRGHKHGPDGAQGEVSRRTRIISILVLQLGIMLHSLVIGLTLSITAGSEFTTLLTAIIFHQLFEGLSLGIRISTLPGGSHKTAVLPAILCILFAITTPTGILLGIIFLPSQPEGSSGHQTALLTKGLMCALSAGMLIYAASVEMLGGDFVMDPEIRQSSLGKQALGLGSLILGMTAMAIIG